MTNTNKAADDARTLFKKAWDEWIDSAEGQQCASLTSLKPSTFPDILENRLWAAFTAGYNSAAHLAAKSEAPDESGLLPCPFCGSKGSITEDVSMGVRTGIGIGGTVHIVGCDNEDCDFQFPGMATKRQALAAWNRRSK